MKPRIEHLGAVALGVALGAGVAQLVPSDDVAPPQHVDVPPDDATTALVRTMRAADKHLVDVGGAIVAPGQSYTMSFGIGKAGTKLAKLATCPTGARKIDDYLCVIDAPGTPGTWATLAPNCKGDGGKSVCTLVLSNAGTQAQRFVGLVRRESFTP